MPDGWDEERIAALARHYDEQTEDSELSEFEAAAALGYVTIQIPTELLPAVQSLLRKHQSRPRPAA